MKVDPSGLAGAAQRIAAAIAAMTAGEPVHPPLAPDDTSTGASIRLTAAATTLAGVVIEQASALATTAAQLSAVAAGFAEQEALNADSVSALGTSGQAGVSGWAGPTPMAPPDVRPPLGPTVALPGEMIAALLTAGSPSAGGAFIADWTRVADAVENAAHVLEAAAAQLPELWNSEVATPVVRGHLLAFAEALDISATRARGLADHARAHAEQYSQAAADVPKPAEFEAINDQLRQASAANVNGRYTAVLASLMARKAELERRALQAYSAYRSDTEATTADGTTPADQLSDLRGRVPAGGGRRPGEMPLGFGGQSEPAPAVAAASSAPPGASPSGGPATDGLPPGVAPAAAASASASGAASAPGGNAAPGDPAGAGIGGAASPEKAGELASMLPQMIPTVLGAAGGLVGGALSAIEKVPESLVQAGSQAAQAATQGLSGLVNPHMNTADVASGLDAPGADPTSGTGTGDVGGGGGADTTPAAGAASPPQVMPSTGPAAHIPTTPTGALPPPVDPTGATPGGMMPMGMPMGAMMPRGASGGQGTDRPAKPKSLVVPPTPHAESVTGKVTPDRIAKSAAAPSPDVDPSDDGGPPGDGDPLRRLRIREVTVRRDES